MQWSWLLCVLLGSLAWGQTAPVPSSRPATTLPTSQDANKDAAEQDTPAPEVPMDATVLTINGFCPGRKPAPDSPCQTAITRAQFEGIAAAIQPAMNTTVKRQLASLYPRLLVMSQEAETQGLDKESQYQQMMAYARMQILTQALTRKLQEQSAQISDSEVTDYYQKNQETFQLYTLQRLFIPMRKQPPDGERDRKGGEKTQPVETPRERSAREGAEAGEMTELAETLRARAAAGEDFVTLQKEAFTVAGIKVESPNTSMGKVRRTSFPATQAAALQLKVGEVSQLITDAGGHAIYKMEAKEQLKLSQVRDEIRGTLINDRLKEAMDKIQNSYTAETNDVYFGPATRPVRGRADDGASPSKKP